jgi:hypothetical protein
MGSQEDHCNGEAADLARKSRVAEHRATESLMPRRTEYLVPGADIKLTAFVHRFMIQRHINS